MAVPLAWFARLAHGTPQERSNWRLAAGGQGIHWPDLDEDASLTVFSRAGDQVRRRSLFAGSSNNSNTLPASLRELPGSFAAGFRVE